MKKSAKTLEKERALLASLKTDEERKEMRAALDQLWQNAIEIARLKIERDKAMREYREATRALFVQRRKKPE